MPQKNILTERIVKAFAAQDNSGFDKFRQVKSAVKTAVEGVEADTRFPSVRELAAALNMGTLPVQRAIMELTAENLLYSRNRMGIFVKEASEKVKVPSINFVEPLRIYAYEPNPHMRELFFETIDHFNNNRCNIFGTKLYFEDPGEASIFIQSPAPDPLDLSGIRQHLPWDQPCQLCSPHTAVIAYQVFGFLWNKKLFAEKGLPEPDYKDYASQKEYFALLNRLFPEKVISCMFPDCFLSKLLTRALTNDQFSTPEGSRLLSGQIREVLHFTGQFHYFFEKEDRVRKMARFKHQELPGIFLASSASYQFCRDEIDFETGFYPLYDVTNCLILQPITMQLGNRMEVLYQSLQLLQYFQSPEVQERFREKNLVTVTGRLPGDLGVFPEEKRSCLFTEDSYIKYVMGSVIRSEMLVTALQKKMEEQALKNIFAYTGIIRFCKDSSPPITTNKP